LIIFEISLYKPIDERIDLCYPVNVKLSVYAFMYIYVCVLHASCGYDGMHIKHDSNNRATRVSEPKSRGLGSDFGGANSRSEENFEIGQQITSLAKGKFK